MMDASGKVGLERTVVVKQERNGYGFGLSKEVPVFVVHVSPGSAAARAGITPGDKLVKVNGVDVVKLKVSEVEDMMQECSHVTLTLLGKLTQNGTKSKESLEISPPKQMQELTLQTMKNMLQKQRKTYETLAVNYCKSPSEKLGREIQDCESVIKVLESEIASKSPPIDAHIRTTTASIQALIGQPPAKKSGDDMDLPSSRKNPYSTASPSRWASKGGSTKRAATFHNGSISPSKRRHHMLGFLGGGSGSHLGDNSDQSDDDDLSDAVDGASEAGPFGSLQELRNNPAHMSVFIHYLNTNKNPNGLLFYVVALSYQNHCKAGDLRQRGMDIFWTFFTDQAPLPVEINSAIKSKAQHTLETEENENYLRSAYVEARESLSESIVTDLADYRHKRVMGLAGIFGDHMLTNNMAIAKQIEVVSSLLIPDIKMRIDDSNCANVTEASRNHAIAACLATFVLDSCGKSGISKALSNPPLDKTQTFTRGDVRKGRGGKKKYTITKHSHIFHLETYSKPTLCDLCLKQLWGIIYHGYQCSECKMNIHRYYCMPQLEQPCLGKNPGFMSTSRRRRTSLHSVKKLHVLHTGSVPPEDTDSDVAARMDLEVGRGSPLLEPGSLDSKEGELMREMEGDDHPLTTKPRSTSDPKHMLLIQSASVMPNDPPDQPNRDFLRVSRTQSAKFDSRQDHMDSKHQSESLPHNLTMSSSDDSLIGAKLESIVEGRGAVFDVEIKELIDHDIEDEPLPWALSVKREVVQSLKPYEVQRQEYIKELAHTERTHLHKLKTMKYLYQIPMAKEGVLTDEQVKQLFPNLEELIHFHGELKLSIKEKTRIMKSPKTSNSKPRGLSTDLKEHMAETTNGVVNTIADVLLKRFDGAAGEKLCHACAISASNQVNADRFFKDWRRKDEKFKIFIRNAELHPVCRRHRLTLTELIPIAWQRLTRYQLLVKNILSSYKKHWEELSDADKEEAQKVETALTCVKGILQYVNKQLHRAENRQRLLVYQSKLDTSALERTSHPIAKQFKLLDLGAERRRLLHEGPLMWKIQNRKLIELYAILLTDILVLLERHEERDKYYLRCYSVESIGGTKEELSPVIRLKDCLLRSAAADKGGRTFLIVNNSSLMKLAQMYEFTAESPQEKRHWEEAIKRAMMGTQDGMSPEPPNSPATADLHSAPLVSSMHGSSQDVIREQLNKIDEDIKRLLNEKLRILQSMQGRSGDRVTLGRKSQGTEEEGEALGDPRDYVAVAIEQAGEVASTLSHVMVTNPTKKILGETQSRLADIIAETQRNFTKLMLSLGKRENSAESGSPNVTEENHEKRGRVENEVKEERGGDESRDIYVQEGNQEQGSAFEAPDGRVKTCEDESDVECSSTSSGLHHLPPADIISLTSQDGAIVVKGEDSIIAPPDTFCGDDSATPTPQPETESGTITPQTSPCDANTPMSPLSPKPQSVTKDSTPPVEATKKPAHLSTSEPTTDSGKEKIVTVTGGPSPRLMRIIATCSSHKAKDTKTGFTTANASTTSNPATGAKPVPAPRKQKRPKTLAPEDSSEDLTVKKHQDYEGTDM